MIEVGTAIRVYSDLNEQIDFMVFIGAYEDLQEVQNIIEDAWNDWWESDEDGQIPIGDYISDRLEESGVEFEIFWKDGGLNDDD